MKARSYREVGAATLEAALVLPLIAILTFAVIDGGLYFSGRAQAGNAARDGARAVAIAGTSPLADFDGLAAVGRSLTGLDMAKVERIVIFKAADFSPDMPLPCRQGNSNPPHNCNVYFPNDFQRPESDFANLTWLGPSGWTPTERSASRTMGADLVGVAVTARVDTPLGVFGARQRSVTRIVIVQMEVNQL